MALKKNYHITCRHFKCLGTYMFSLDSDAPRVLSDIVTSQLDLDVSNIEKYWISTSGQIQGTLCDKVLYMSWLWVLWPHQNVHDRPRADNGGNKHKSMPNFACGYDFDVATRWQTWSQSLMTNNLSGDQINDWSINPAHLTNLLSQGWGSHIKMSQLNT